MAADSAWSSGLEDLIIEDVEAAVPDGKMDDIVDLTGDKADTVMSIDPGKKNTGLAIINPQTHELLFVDVLTTDFAALEKVQDKIASLITTLDTYRTSFNVQYVVIERQFKNVALVRVEMALNMLAAGWQYAGGIRNWTVVTPARAHKWWGFTSEWRDTNGSRSKQYRSNKKQAAIMFKDLISGSTGLVSGRSRPPAASDYVRQLLAGYSKIDDIADAYLNGIYAGSELWNM